MAAIHGRLQVDPVIIETRPPGETVAHAKGKPSLRDNY